MENVFTFIKQVNKVLKLKYWFYDTTEDIL